MTCARTADRESASQELLRARAVALAREPVSEQNTGMLDLTVFTLARETYGVESRLVGEVLGLTELIPVPGAPSFIAGVMNLRGMILTLLDIKIFFDLPKSGLNDLHQVITVRDEGMQVGLLADTLVGMQTLPLSEVQSSLPTLTGRRADYLKGVTREGLVILDLEKLLRDPVLMVNQTTHEHDH